jgi:adenylate cyclase
MALSAPRGDAIVGAMGPPGPQIITAIGDTVNTASRLEGLNKEMRSAIVLSRKAAELANLRMDGNELPSMQVKGKAEAVEFYALENPVGVP